MPLLVPVTPEMKTMMAPATSAGTKGDDLQVGREELHVKT